MFGWALLQQRKVVHISGMLYQYDVPEKILQFSSDKATHLLLIKNFFLAWLTCLCRPTIFNSLPWTLKCRLHVSVEVVFILLLLFHKVCSYFL